jgi:hypothetical protein
MKDAFTDIERHGEALPRNQRTSPFMHVTG